MVKKKKSSCQCRAHRFDPWIRKIPWRRKWQPIPVFLAWKSHEQGSLKGYSSWGHKKSQTWLNNLTTTIFITFLKYIYMYIFVYVDIHMHVSRCACVYVYTHIYKRQTWEHLRNYQDCHTAQLTGENLYHSLSFGTAPLGGRPEQIAWPYVIAVETTLLLELYFKNI